MIWTIGLIPWILFVQFVVLPFTGNYYDIPFLVAGAIWVQIVAWICKSETVFFDY